MTHELLLEIGTEEIPAGFLLPAMDNLEGLLEKHLQALALPFGRIRTAATPRRLAISVADLAERQPDRQEEIMGPPAKAALTPEGGYTKAAEGFARSRGAKVEELQVVSTPKGDYVMLAQEQKGSATPELLADLLPKLIREIPFPKSMRWGSTKIHFARPIQWLLALYGGQTIPFTLDEQESGSSTRGHRFLAPRSQVVGGFDDYLDTLKDLHVLADYQERRQAVLTEIEQAARQAGGQILSDPELVDTVTNLVEEPHAVCGSFDKRFLALPRAVLITSLREHQKCFAVVDDNGNLLPHFVAVNNTLVKDVRLTAQGHERVLRARLEDAFFFFREDQARPLEARVADLKGVIFQTRLGTLLEKTDRVTRLAGLLARELAPDLLDVAQRSAYLAKADLLTAMVNEFPSLQGAIGRDYALLNGEKEEVAAALGEHYLPVRAGGELPRTMAGAVVSLADRLDTLAGCFGINQIPTGTTDPFGLRRQALGLLRIIEDQQFGFSLDHFLAEALSLYQNKLTVESSKAKELLLDFIKGRYVNELTARGVLPEAVEAVTSVSFDNVADCGRRIEALVAISAQPEFSLLAGAFKRVMNIIKDNQESQVEESLLAEGAESDLYAAYQAVARESEPLLAANKYREALAVILKMKEPVDRFFDEVMVMAEDEALRRNRLNLLTAVARLFLRIGDFSKMYAVAPQG